VISTPADLALLRLAAQRIAGPGFETPAAAVRWLTALQAQDYPGALTSVALRIRSRGRADVEAALTAGEVVKSWPLRGTLHFVPAEDLPWLLDLTAAREITGAARRHADLGLDERSFELARELAVQALHGRRELSRAALQQVWEQAGLSTAGQRGYHLIWRLALTGTLCFGPVRGGEQHLVLLAEWAPRTSRPERDEALGELASRYFRGHGPATVKDLARWAKLLAADVRTAVAIARPALEKLEVDGVEYLMDPRTPDRLADCREQAEAMFLLPGFDEYMLGYGDRTAALPAQFADRIVPGGNGMFRSTVVCAGQVVGTWVRTGRGPGRTLQATAFTQFSKEVEAALPRLYDLLP
jgi:hypothetical protein